MILACYHNEIVKGELDAESPDLTLYRILFSGSAGSFLIIMLVLL